jgi:hypothetical protein
MEQSIKSSSINYGLYLGGALALLTVIAYAANLDLLVSVWYGILILIAVIAFGIVSVAKSKAILEGYISFKNSFASYFLTIFIGLLISTLVSYILFNFIDPEAAVTLKEKTIESQVQMLEGFNVPNEQIAEQVELLENQDNFSIINIIKGFAIYLVMFSIIGLIVAAVMKKNNPDAQ